MLYTSRYWFGIALPELCDGRKSRYHIEANAIALQDERLTLQEITVFPYGRLVFETRLNVLQIRKRLIHKSFFVSTMFRCASTSCTRLKKIIISQGKLSGILKSKTYINTHKQHAINLRRV